MPSRNPRQARYGPRPDDTPDRGLLYAIAQKAGLSATNLVRLCGHRPQRLTSWRYYVPLEVRVLLEGMADHLGIDWRTLYPRAPGTPAARIKD